MVVKKEKKIKDCFKEIILKNNYVFVFCLLGFFVLVISLFRYINFFFGSVFFEDVLGIFSFFWWFFLGLMFLLSGILAYFEKYKLMFLPLIVWLLFITVIVRISNMGGLKDITTNDWILGPDLDPYLFLRNAIEISRGSINRIDLFRQAPLGAFNQYVYRNLMPWSIFGIYKIINLFGEFSVTYAAIIAPVIFFLMSIIGFFLFVYFIFSFKFSIKKSLTGATIASFFYSFAPSMLYRTIAGIPELESLGMVFFWPALIFFVLAWKEIKKRKWVLFGMISGIFTGAMSLTWGGYKYIFMTVALVAFIVFIFERDRNKNLIIYLSFLIPAIIFEIFKTGKIETVITSLSDSGFAVGVLFFMIISYFLFNTRLYKKIKINRINFPKNIILVIVSTLIITITLIILNPSLLFNSLLKIIEGLLYPFGRERIALTITENRAPYFTEVFRSFGYLFWLFYFGAIALFYSAIKHFNLKKKIILNFSFILFLSSLIFSRISPQHTLNGENFLSRILYFGGLAIFLGILIWFFSRAHFKKDLKTIECFKKIDISYLVLLALSFWATVSMRGAVRLFFIISPIFIIVSTYLILRFSECLNIKGKMIRTLIIFIFAVILFATAHVFIYFSYSTVHGAKNMVPSDYDYQWQKAMNFVRTKTPQGSIFVHWWDYGYWIQTLGERPTVTDGRHINKWFVHTTARYLMTTPFPETALSLIKSMNISYLLIDSTDIEKYPTFSGIGSDESRKDRLSMISVIPLDARQTQETDTGEIRAYIGGNYVDKDIIYDLNGVSLLLPSERAILKGVLLEISNRKELNSFSRPIGVFSINNNQYRIPIRYLYLNGEILDFEIGINSLIQVMPSIQQNISGEITIDRAGAVVYLSEKVKDSLFAHLYLMDDPLGKYPTIKLAHIESDFIINDLRSRGIEIGEFVYYQGLKGPIKIWDTRTIPENILIRQEFLMSFGEYAELDNLEFIK